MGCGKQTRVWVGLRDSFKINRNIACELADKHILLDDFIHTNYLSKGLAEYLNEQINTRGNNRFILYVKMHNINGSGFQNIRTYSIRELLELQNSRKPVGDMI